MYRKTFLEIDLNKYAQNCDLFINKTKKKMIAVVKANAYGAIDYYIASFLMKKGVDFFAVSSLDEALRLKNHGINANILIMGYVNELEIVKENNFAVIIPNLEYVERYLKELKDVRCHIKVNTGLNRLGLFPEECDKALKMLLDTGAKVEGVMTHYACTDNVEYTNQQYQLFEKTVKSLNYKFEYIHSMASDAALYLDDKISTHQRIGLGLLGYTNIENDWPLQPCISLKAEVVYSKQVKKGDGVSYNHHYISDGEGYILTLAIGYADGVNKKMEGQKVYVNGEEGTIVGTICMDLMMVKVSKPHPVGELVEIFGEHHNVYERREQLGECCCKIITDISDRVSRRYIQDDKVVDIIDPRI